MSYYIKSNFGKLKEINGEPLEIGVNAFNSMEALQKYGLGSGENIILLDSKYKFTGDIIPEWAYIYSGKYIDYYEYDCTYKATGSLELNKVYTYNNFYNFKTVKVSNSTICDVFGGELIETDKDNGNGTGKWTDEFKATGKFTLTDHSSAMSVTGYADVIVQDSSVSSIQALSMEFYTETNTVYPGYYKEDENSSFVYNADKNSVSGKITYADNFKAVGSVTVSGDSEVSNIYGFAKITIKDNAIVSSINGCSTSDYKKVQTFKTTKNGTNVVETVTQNSAAAGSVTADGAGYLGNFYGVKTVNLVNTGVASIENYRDRKYSREATYSFSDASEVFNYTYYEEDDFSFDFMNSGAPASKSKEKSITKTSGSASIKLDKNAEEDIYVGAINNYAKIDIAGYKEYGISVDYIYSNGDTTEEKTFDNGTETTISEQKASGSVTLKDNVTVYADLNNIEKVSLKNSTVGIITASDCNDGFAGYYRSLYSTSANGSHKTETESKAIGSVSLDNSSCSGIRGYAQVTLKNGTVYGSVDSAINSKYTYSYDAKKDKYYDDYKVSQTNKFTAENSYIDGSISYFNTVKLTNTDMTGGIYGISSDSVVKNTSTLTITTNAKTATRDTYKINYIQNFKDVAISGVCDFKKGNFICVETGYIYGSGKLTLKNNVWVRDNIEGFKDISITTCQIGGIYSYGEGEEYQGSVTVSDTICGGSIYGYKTVKYTKGDIYGEIYASDVTLSDTDVEGSVYADKLTIAQSHCKVYSYEGKTLTVKKGALLDIGDIRAYEGGTIKVDGTIVLLQSNDFYSNGVTSITGKGMIVADRYVYDSTAMLNNSKVKFVNLGETVEGFHGQAAEAADNTAKKAAEADWDIIGENYYELDGLLGKGTEIEDTCDWIKFTAEADGYISFMGLGEADTLTVNGKKLDGFDFEISADTDYKVCVTRNEEDSTHYTAYMQLA